MATQEIPLDHMHSRILYHHGQLGEQISAEGQGSSKHEAHIGSLQGIR